MNQVPNSPGPRPEPAAGLNAPGARTAGQVWATLLTIAAFGILSAGIATVIQSLRLSDPPSAIPASALCIAAQAPHPYCGPATTGRVTATLNITISHHDLAGFSRSLQDFAHRQGGCYHNIYDRRAHTAHRLTLPDSAIRQIMTLNRHNYSQLAAPHKTADSVPGINEFRQVEVYATSSKHGRKTKWTAIIGLITATIGILASIATVSNYVDTIRSRPKPTRPSPSSSPTA